MQPAQLTAASFAGYPPEGRRFAVEQLGLLRDLPLVLLPILLRELIAWDWKLPAERRALREQIEFLSGLSAAERAALMQGFRELPIEGGLSTVDWVHEPAAFLEQLTASLWSTHQMERFRALAESYAAAVNAHSPEQPPGMPRMGVVIFGAGAERAEFPLFRKLRPHGVYLTGVKPEYGLAILLAGASRRAALPGGREAGGAFLHWYIDGGAAVRGTTGLTEVSYAGLEPARALLLERIQRAIGSGGMGPEELRSLLARMKPGDVGLSEAGPAAVLNHFQLSLLTEGAGTQIFATTFAQWAARECARRAQPETLVVRYAPRQQAQTMNAMLSGVKPSGLDLAGSLVDADMGAYYTWLSLRRLSGADGLRFLVWFEGHREAMVLGPNLPHGTSSDTAMDMHQVLALLG